MCYLDDRDGYKSVISALSDYRVAFDESFRFEGLVASLQLRDDAEEDEIFSSDEETAHLVWEARCASMTLVNALTTYSDTVEERVLLREEFARRGLNEAIVVCYFIHLPFHAHCPHV